MLDFIVVIVGFEPTRCKATDFESIGSANSPISPSKHTNMY